MTKTSRHAPFNFEKEMEQATKYFHQKSKQFVVLDIEFLSTEVLIYLEVEIMFHEFYYF